MGRSPRPMAPARVHVGPAPRHPRHHRPALVVRRQGSEHALPLGPRRISHLYRERFRTLLLVRNLDRGVSNRPLPGSYRFTVSRRGDAEVLQALKRRYPQRERMFDWE